jgi:hypothetical protein
MDSTTKGVYMAIVQQRYHKANRKGKSKILDEIVANLPIHRKSAIRLVNTFTSSRKPRKRTRCTLYGKKVLWIIEELWKLLDYPCGSILKASVLDWLPHLKKYYPIDKPTVDDLLKISPSTIDRSLKKKKKYIKGKIYGTTKPSYILRTHIPIRTSSAHITTPGSLELDTVAHCGNSNAGEFIYTVNGVDIATTWVTRCAVLGKGQFKVKNAINSMRETLPFPLIDIDFDNGDEFLNYTLIAYCNSHSIGFTRSRPYKKDDQAHIEQKNSTHVRRIFGHIRLDKPEVLHLINDLYAHELNWYHNFFKPSFKLLEKKCMGARIKRTFEKPRTAYQRVLASDHISAQSKRTLTKLFESLNPIELKRTIDSKIKHIFYLQSLPLTEAKAS